MRLASDRTLDRPCPRPLSPLALFPRSPPLTQAAWDACANPPGRSFEEAEGERFNPFLTHAFLQRSRPRARLAAVPAGRPRTLAVEDARGRMVAAAPCYLKSHSQGEYVFDHAWADAYERAGGDYYPKLQVAVPFTPVTGRRLLVAADAPEGAREALIGALGQLRKQTKTSSIHVTFPTVEDAERLSQRRISDPQWRAVPFLLRRLLEFRRLPRGLGLPQAQGDQARAARRSGRRSHDRVADWRRRFDPSTGTHSSSSTCIRARASGAART